MHTFRFHSTQVFNFGLHVWLQVSSSIGEQKVQGVISQSKHGLPSWGEPKHSQITKKN